MKILLVQTGFLGDAVLSTAVVGAIRRVHASAEIWVMTTPQAAELFSRDPEVTGVIPFHKRSAAKGIKGLAAFASELREKKFDCVYSLHKSARTAILLWLAGIPKRVGFSRSSLAVLYTHTVLRPENVHEVARALSILEPEFAGELRREYDGVCRGCSSEPLGQLRLFLVARDELSDAVRSLTNGEHRYAVLVPGSAWETKRWKWQGFCDVGRALLREGIQVVLIGSRDEQDVAQKISDHITVTNLVGATSLAEATALIDKAAVVVCNDSLALHIASARKTPAVAIFCATTPRFGFGPWQDQAAVVEKKDLFCKPCCRHGARRCPHGTDACMVGVDSREVLVELRKLAGVPLIADSDLVCAR